MECPDHKAQVVDFHHCDNKAYAVDGQSFHGEKCSRADCNCDPNNNKGAERDQMDQRAREEPQ
jgi:hypothetical protein